MSHATQILLATAIRDHADAYERVLEKNGFHVHVARTGADATRAALGQRFDCVVIDLRLPDISGWELCGQMKRLPELRATPIIILTPDISMGHCDEGARVGCHAWLARPTVAEDLVDVIAEVIAQGRPQPRSRYAALVGADRECPACASRHLRASIRVSPVQYYRCVDCGFCWRVEVVPTEQPA
jgi:CheY-like chemotaxis protein/Zn ribbon nucleic-acid-binding protein